MPILISLAAEHFYCQSKYLIFGFFAGTYQFGNTKIACQTVFHEVAVTVEPPKLALGVLGNQTVALNFQLFSYLF